MKLVFVLFGSHTKEKYKNQILKINATWANIAQKHNIPLLYFLNETPHDFETKENISYINLPIINDDYNTTLKKQNIGLKIAYEKYNPDFIFLCGTDTFPNVENVLKLLKAYDCNSNICIGGHGTYRTVLGREMYYHSGGAGLLFSNGCLKKLHPHFESMENIWYDVWEKSKIYFKPQRGISKGASDVAICQFMQQKKINTQLVIEKNFYHCNYLGLPCINHRLHKKPNIHEIVSCHQMSLQDFDAYYNLIKDC